MTGLSHSSDAVISLGFFAVEIFSVRKYGWGAIPCRACRIGAGIIPEGAAADGPFFSDATTFVMLLLLPTVSLLSVLRAKCQRSPPRRSRRQIWVYPYRRRQESTGPSLRPCSWESDDISTSEVPFSLARNVNLSLVGQSEGRSLGNRPANNATACKDLRISDDVVGLGICRSGDIEAPRS